MEIDACTFFRVTRNANTELSEEDKAEDLLAMIETELRERKFAPIVRLEVASETMSAGPPRACLAADLGLDEEEDVFEVDATRGMLGMRQPDGDRLLAIDVLQESVDAGALRPAASSGGPPLARPPTATSSTRSATPAR